MNLYDEVADMMAASWTVGPHASREQIVAALRVNYATEADLRAAMNGIDAQIKQAYARIEAEGGTVIGIGKEAKP